MNFFDCNCWIGLPRAGHLKPARSAAELLAAMDRSGIERALVWHVSQRDYTPTEGNRLLAEAIAGHADRLTGCWSLLPTQCGDFPAPAEFFPMMREKHIAAVRVFPDAHHWLLRREVVGNWMAELTRRRIPLLLSVGDPSWNAIYALLADFPNLTCVLCGAGLWGPDRWVRPLIETYPNVRFEISEYILAGGIEAFVKSYGPERLLFGTGFPQWDHGGIMLALRHAPIPEPDKAAIASGNLERMLGSVVWE